MGNLIDARCPKMTRMDPNHFPYMWIWIFLESCFNRTNGQNICFFLFVMRGWGHMGLLWYGFARFMVWFCGNFQVTFHLSADKYNRQNQKCGLQALPENFRSNGWCLINQVNTVYALLSYSIVWSSLCYFVMAWDHCCILCHDITQDMLFTWYIVHQLI